MLHTIESQAKKRKHSQFDAISSAVCQFCKSAPIIPLIEVNPAEEAPYKLIRYAHGVNFITIRTIGRSVELSVHKKYNFDVPNDHHADRELISELRNYLSKSLGEVKFKIKQLGSNQ